MLQRHLLSQSILGPVDTLQVGFISTLVLFCNLHILEAVLLTSNARNGGRARDAAREADAVMKRLRTSAMRMSRDMTVMGTRMRSVEPVRHHTTSSNIQLPTSLPQNSVIKVCRPKSDNNSHNISVDVQYRQNKSFQVNLILTFGHEIFKLW